MCACGGDDGNGDYSSYGLLQILWFCLFYPSRPSPTHFVRTHSHVVAIAIAFFFHLCCPLCALISGFFFREAKTHNILSASRNFYPNIILFNVFDRIRSHFILFSLSSLFLQIKSITTSWVIFFSLFASLFLSIFSCSILCVTHVLKLPRSKFWSERNRNGHRIEALNIVLFALNVYNMSIRRRTIELRTCIFTDLSTRLLYDERLHSKITDKKTEIRMCVCVLLRAVSCEWMWISNGWMSER